MSHGQTQDSDRTVRVPDHAQQLSPADARLLAVDLVHLADDAEGHESLDGFVTRWEVLAELADLRRTVVEFVYGRETGVA